MQWTIGQEEYNRHEVEALLQTQRAMIYNDLNYSLQAIQKRKGVVGKFTDEQSQILDHVKNCRKPEY